MKKLLTALALGSVLAATAYAQRPQTDREHDGLKGPVKSVTTEVATLKKQGGRYVEEGRGLEGRVTYNAEGMRAEDEWYAGDDTPFTKNVYRYVGGEKLADARVRLPTIVAPIVVPRPAGPDKQPAPRPASLPDPMESSSQKYKYKYDDKGRVTEMVIERDGRVWLRVTYDHQGDRREMRTYQREGGRTLTFRQVDRFDAQGNLVESTAFNVNMGGRVDKSSYTEYEFDARGNWVKRLKAESVGGEPEEREVEYRTITYF